MGAPRTGLDARLRAIAQMAGRCGLLADIGTDHGRLGAFLLESGQCDRVVFTDISSASLEKARRRIRALGLMDRAVFSAGDGAAALLEPPEAAVIAGMGGTTIAGILRRGRRELGEARLVLQPNVGAPEVRQALAETGWAVTDERVVQEGRRNYVLIGAAPGRAEYSPEELTVGPVLLIKRPPELLPYARFRLRVARKALAGATAGEDLEAMEALRTEIGIWEEMERCLRP